MAVAGVSGTRAIARIDRRTLLGVFLAAVAALLVLIVTQPAPTVPVLIAAENVPAGVPLDASLVQVRQVAASEGLVEGSSLGELSGWTLAAPLSAGEPLVPSLLRPPALQENPDLFALSLPESHAVLGRLAPGDRIDIFVTWPGSIGEPGITEVLAAGVYVVDARVDDGSLNPDRDVALLLAVDQDLALAIAGAVRNGDIDLMKVGP